MALVWDNISLRSTSGGAASWAGGAINASTDVDPNDASNRTTVYLPASDAYPLAYGTGAHNFGRKNGSAFSGSNASKTNAGSNTLLGGSFQFASGGQTIQIDLNAGNYVLRSAAGSVSGGARSALLMFEGTDANLFGASGLNTHNIGFWAASTAVSSGDIRVSKTDKTVWKCTTAGTTSTTEPSGAGPTFTDGTAVWTLRAERCFAWFDQTTASASEVVDITNVKVAASAWGANTLSVTITETSICLIKVLSVACDLRQFSMQEQVATLADIPLHTDYNVSEGTSPTFYAKQPSGYFSHKLNVTTGSGGLANLALGGNLAPYFTLTLDGSSNVWLVANGTPMPDSAVTSPTLTIIQTDAAASGSPHTTTYTPTVVTSGGRSLDSSNVLGKITTQSYLRRARVKSYTDAIWAGYANQSFASDQTATSGSDLATKMAAITPNGTSWYRIKLGAGTYTGLNGGAINKDFGTGGLLIEPETGVGPDVDCAFGSLEIHGLHIRNCRLTGDVLLMGSDVMFTFNDPGGTGIGGGGRFNKIKMDSNKVGFRHKSGAVESEWATRGCDFIRIDHAESFEFHLNHAWGVDTFIFMGGIHVSKVHYNLVEASTGDFQALTAVPNYDTTLGVFANNDVYLESSHNVIRDEVDYVGYVNGDHCDFAQNRSMGSAHHTSYVWYANSGQNGGGTPFVVGSYVVRPESGIRKIYIASAVTTGLTGATGPVGTGTGEVDGGVTWDYYHDFSAAMRPDEYFLFEENFVQSAYPVSAGTTGRQILIDNNADRGANLFVTSINNIWATSVDKGLQIGEGEIYAERNTFAGPFDLNASVSLGGQYIRSTTTGDVRALNNLVGAVAAVTTGKLSDHGNLVVDFRAAAATPNLPNERLRGPFTQGSASRWVYQQLDQSTTPTKEAFIAQMKYILHGVGDAGYYEGAGGSVGIAGGFSYGYGYGLIDKRRRRR